MRRVLVLGTAIATFAGLAALAAPASAETDTTSVTFELVGGGLAIDAPATANLGQVAASASLTTVTGQLGDTTVTDTRGGLLSAYQVFLSAGDFTTGAGGTNEKIVGSTVTGMSGPVTHTNTTATAVPTATTTGVASTVPIAGLSAFNGSDAAVYNPTISIPIPATNAAGAYSGVVTQTVLAVL